MINVEICASSVHSVIEAVKGGAIRVELCDNLSEGGTTPPLSWIEKSVEISDLQTFVLIRPRGGDFLYTDIEYNTMKRDIIHCGMANCHGVVIGILTDDGKIDMDRNSELVKLAKQYSMSVTFHRAIDRSDDIYGALENIIELGCDRILTSGGYSTATEGKEVIKNLVDKSNGRIIIMPGGGINEENVAELVRYTGVEEFHGSFRENVESKMKFKKESVDSYSNDFVVKVTSARKVTSALENANKV